MVAIEKSKSPQEAIRLNRIVRGEARVGIKRYAPASVINSQLLHIDSFHVMLYANPNPDSIFW